MLHLTDTVLNYNETTPNAPACGAGSRAPVEVLTAAPLLAIHQKLLEAKLNPGPIWEFPKTSGGSGGVAIFGS